MPGRYSVSLRMCAGHKPFVLHQALVRVGFYFLTCDFRVQLWMWCCTKCYDLANNFVEKVSVMWCCTKCYRLANKYRYSCGPASNADAKCSVTVIINQCLCKQCVLVLYGLHVWFND